jgi:hypothetical protein
MTVVVAFAVLLCPPAWTQVVSSPGVEQPNFNGRWRENLHASRRVDGRDLTDVYTFHVMTLEQKDTQLHISLDIRVPDPKNNRVITYDLQTDGRVYDIDLGDAKGLAYARWEEGSSLTIYLKRRMADGVVLEVLRTMTLGKDSRKMTALMRSWRDGRPTNSVKEVWERQ